MLHPECMEFAICKSNQVLLYPDYSVGTFSNKRLFDFEELFGLKSKIRLKVAEFMSEILAKAFFGAPSKNHHRNEFSTTDFNDLYLRSISAASSGRNGTDCKKTFPKCHMGLHLQPQPDFIRQVFH